MEIFYSAKNFMGRLIGQKGVTINDLQRRSACDIQINQDVSPGQECEISIRGTRPGIEMAKQMLREIIEIGKLVIRHELPGTAKFLILDARL
jgi:rRNA processing protein Krr1/Pno1